MASMEGNKLAPIIKVEEKDGSRVSASTSNIERAGGGDCGGHSGEKDAKHPVGQVSRGQVGSHGDSSNDPPVVLLMRDDAHDAQERTGGGGVREEHEGEGRQ